MAGIALVLNPLAKQHARDPSLADRLARVLGDEGVVRPVATFEQLSTVVDEIRTRSFDVIAIAGGDGTTWAKEVLGDCEHRFVSDSLERLQERANAFGVRLTQTIPKDPDHAAEGSNAVKIDAKTRLASLNSNQGGCCCGERQWTTRNTRSTNPRTH